MRLICIVCLFACVSLSRACAQEAQETSASERTELTPSSWSPPKSEFDLGNLKPAAVSLVAGPDLARELATLQYKDYTAPKVYVPTNQDVIARMKTAEQGYTLLQAGLDAGVMPYTDRTYKIRELQDELSGLTLLQTKMADKGFVDGRFSIVLSTEKPCYVFVAIDERAIAQYRNLGIPAWLREFSVTDHRIATDEPIMKQQGAQYHVFVKKTLPGRIALGPPCCIPRCMYFAFFAEAI